MTAVDDLTLRAVDPHSFFADPDPAAFLMRIRIQLGSSMYLKHIKTKNHEACPNLTKFFLYYNYNYGTGTGTNFLAFLYFKNVLFRIRTNL